VFDPGVRVYLIRGKPETCQKREKFDKELRARVEFAGGKNLRDKRKLYVSFRGN